jgi:large subunit ribosomal protein L2
MLVQSRATTSSQRHRVRVKTPTLYRGEPEKSLLAPGHHKRQGRGFRGHVTVRHRGNSEKKRLRMIDWKREKRDVAGVVQRIEYDPNRSAHIALVHYKDGDKRYILAPEGLSVGQEVVAGATAEVRPGNALPLSQVPVGVPIHNLELYPGKGAQMVRGAGVAAMVQSKEGLFVTVLLPSKEVRLIKGECFATIGQVGNQEWKNRKLGKAGRKRHMGIRPTVRGVAQHPNNHPHGGGEGRSGIGLPYPKTPWGKHALGTKTRKRKKPSTRFIVKDRRVK